MSNVVVFRAKDIEKKRRKKRGILKLQETEERREPWDEDELWEHPFQITINIKKFS